MTPALPALTWDIFCHVVDNLGDLGVSWRLAHQLAQRGQRVRLWVDEPAALDWMAPGALQGHVPGLQVHTWPRERIAHTREAPPTGLLPSDVLIEAFGCEVTSEWVRALQPDRVAGAPDQGPSRLWLNLEYLSAETYVERCHGLPSPVMQGPLQGRTKWFFYPGFTPLTGGLLREPELEQSLPEWQPPPAHRPAQIALFCYEPEALGAALALPLLARAHWRVAHGRATTHMRATLQASPGHNTDIEELPALPQAAFDRLLCTTDLNFVRGEDSLVRALWAGRPLVWQLYPQHDGAHRDKLEAFLDWLDAPAPLRRFHHVWNGTDKGPLPEPDWLLWGECVQAARARLLAQPDLVSQLIGFVASKR